MWIDNCGRNRLMIVIAAICEKMYLRITGKIYYEKN